jgi:hypothetical protein
MERPAVPMPLRVRVACVALIAAVGGLAVHGVRLLPDIFAAAPSLLMVALGVPAVVGTIRGRPLGWQAARVFGGLLAMGATLLVMALFFTGRFPMSPLLLLCGLLIVIGLSPPAAMRYFDLYCGSCKTPDVRADDIWIHAVTCRKCGRSWKPHTRVDPEVFD